MENFFSWIVSVDLVFYLTPFNFEPRFTYPLPSAHHLHSTVRDEVTSVKGSFLTKEKVTRSIGSESATRPPTSILIHPFPISKTDRIRCLRRIFPFLNKQRLSLKSVFSLWLTSLEGWRHLTTPNPVTPTKTFIFSINFEGWSGFDLGTRGPRRERQWMLLQTSSCRKDNVSGMTKIWKGWISMDVGGQVSDSNLIDWTSSLFPLWENSYKRRSPRPVPSSVNTSRMGEDT